MDSKPNFVLLTIECLRKESFFNKENTPYIHQLMDFSTVYTNFHQAGSWTPTSLKALFTSVLPCVDGGRLDLFNYQDTLTAGLHENGYFTIGVTTGGWLSAQFGYSRGFDKFFDGWVNNQEEQTKKRKTAILRKIGKSIPHILYFYRILMNFSSRARDAELFNQLAKKFLKEKSPGKPFFLWIHYHETHEPYYPPSIKQKIRYNILKIISLNKKIMKTIRTRKSNELKITSDELTMLKNLYEDELRYIDTCIGDLLHYLEANNLFDENTYIFISGDHGQQFTEHGDVGHGIDLYEELIQVPLLVVNKKQKYSENDKMISGIDIAPSIFDLAKIKASKQFCGISFFSDTNSLLIAQESRNVRNEILIKNNTYSLNMNNLKNAIIKYPFKLITKKNNERQLFNLEVDPFERNDISSDKENQDIIRSLMEEFSKTYTECREKDSVKLKTLQIIQKIKLKKNRT